MDYEKKYKEAVCNIQKLLENGRKEGEVICAYEADFMSIFPELKDTEDEKIRKGLIEYFKDFRLGTFAGLEPKKIIDWLEKQGEKSQGKSALEAAKEEKVDNANKVEPKFKVGDWVCDDIMRIPLRVDEVLSDMYRLTDNTGGIYYQKKCDVEAVYHIDLTKEMEWLRNKVKKGV